MAARLQGDTLIWILDDGTEYDSGKVLKGNPNKF